MKPKEKPKYNVLQNVGWMAGLAWKIRKRVLFFCVLSAILVVLLNLTQLYIAPQVLACVERQAPIGELLGTIGAFTAALFLIQGLDRYISENTLFARVDVRSGIIGKISEKCCVTSYPNTLEEPFIKLREKAHDACSGNNQATEHIWQTLTMLLANIGGLVVYLGILSRINGLLLLVIVATCVAGFLVSRHANSWRYAHKEEEEKYFQKVNYLQIKSESVALAKDIRVFGLQNWLEELLTQAHELYLDFILRRERVEVLADLTAVALTMARNGIAYVVLINKALHEGLPVSEFLLYFTAVTTFTDWVMGILREMSALHKESLDISLVREFLDYPEPFRFDGGAAVPKAAGYELKLEGVSYRYPGAQEDTLHDLDLTVHPGEKLAIVGLNGAGKTTLVKLLCGLLDPTAGKVLLNGIDIRKYRYDDYMGLFSVVFQDFQLLAQPLGANVAGSVEYDRDRARRALVDAGFGDRLEVLGLDAMLYKNLSEEGVDVSGGEAQKIAIARALYKDAPFIILDEPTAALDPMAEAEIYSKFDEIAGDKTAIYISHRLSSCKFCDEIAVFQDGRIVQRGSHEALVADEEGKYYQLWSAQAQYYTAG